MIPSHSNVVTARLDAGAIQQAAKLLSQGLLVAMPTETVYGLAADATNPVAIERLYRAKGRPSNHPVIVHVCSIESVSDWAVNIPEVFYSLAAKFWPGPVTIVLKRAPGVLDQVTGGQDTVALRMPRHPIALELIRVFGCGIAAPSANKFGHVSPTTGEHVRSEFTENEVAMVLDGGACEVGIESTIIDLSSPTLRVLRPGMITETQIEQCLTTDVVSSTCLPKEHDVRVPGSLPSHYAPRTALHLSPPMELNQCIDDAIKAGLTVAVMTLSQPVINTNVMKWVSLPADASGFAHDMYNVIRELDDVGADLIIVELPPSGGEWTGVLDRLTRAAQR